MNARTNWLVAVALVTACGTLAADAGHRPRSRAARVAWRDNRRAVLPSQAIGKDDRKAGKQRDAKQARPKSHKSAKSVVGLYPCVRYKDTDEIAPDAVPMIIMVPNPGSVPSWRTPYAGRYQPPTMVLVKIMVPRGGACRARVGHHLFWNRRMRFDFGEYRVDVRLKSNGWVEVDYQKD